MHFNFADEDSFQHNSVRVYVSFDKRDPTTNHISNELHYNPKMIEIKGTEYDVKT